VPVWRFTWRPLLSEFERVLGRQSMDGEPGAEIRFIS